jgi:hypothetical protein
MHGINPVRDTTRSADGPIKAHVICPIARKVPVAKSSAVRSDGCCLCLEALAIIKRETSGSEELMLDEARDRIMVIRGIEGGLRIQMAPLME